MFLGRAKSDSCDTAVERKDNLVDVSEIEHFKCNIESVALIFGAVSIRTDSDSHTLSLGFGN